MPLSPDQIREMRVALGLTQLELATRSALSPVTISRAENGHESVAVGALRQIEQALKIAQEGVEEAPADNKWTRFSRDLKEIEGYIADFQRRLEALDEHEEAARRTCQAALEGLEAQLRRLLEQGPQ